MIQRYCKGIFTEVWLIFRAMCIYSHMLTVGNAKAYKKTIGVDFLEKKLRSGNEG